MGGFNPVAALGVLQLGFDALQRTQQARSAQEASEAQARAQIEQIRSAQAHEEQQRQRALKKAMATQRARFGAQGLSPGGSANAVISGLAAEADAEDRQGRELARLRIDRLNTKTAMEGRRNLLEASQPTYRAAFGLLRNSLRRISLLDQ